MTVILTHGCTLRFRHFLSDIPWTPISSANFSALFSCTCIAPLATPTTLHLLLCFIHPHYPLSIPLRVPPITLHGSLILPHLLSLDSGVRFSPGHEFCMMFIYATGRVLPALCCMSSFFSTHRHSPTKSAVPTSCEPLSFIKVLCKINVSVRYFHLQQQSCKGNITFRQTNLYASVYFCHSYFYTK